MILLPVFFTALALVIWAAIFELPLLPGLMTGCVAGVLIGAWYYRSVKKARQENAESLRECVNMNSTILSVILFIDLFASMLVWTAKELF